MNELVHPLTRRQLQEFIESPSHAVMLAGPAGVGKAGLAVGLAERLLNESLSVYPYKLQIDVEDGKTIGIETVRQLEHFLSLKVPDSKPINRLVIINNAQMLTVEAQNALLKTLEEPPVGSVIIMNVSNAQALLPTIRSRLQTITVKKPEKNVIEAYFAAAGYDAQAVGRAYVISGGLPSVMQALLADAEHPLLLAVAQARHLLSKSTFERLLMVDELAQQRQLALNITGILQQMADVSLPTSNGAVAQKWQKVLKAGYQASEALSANAQPKLVLTRLMLAL